MIELIVFALWVKGHIRFSRWIQANWQDWYVTFYKKENKQVSMPSHLLHHCRFCSNSTSDKPLGIELHLSSFILFVSQFSSWLFPFRRPLYYFDLTYIHLYFLKLLVLLLFVLSWLQIIFLTKLIDFNFLCYATFNSFVNFCCFFSLLFKNVYYSTLSLSV